MNAITVKFIGDVGRDCLGRRDIRISALGIALFELRQAACK